MSERIGLKHINSKSEIKKDLLKLKKYIEHQIDNINKIDVDPNSNYTYKKLLFSCLLDSLGQIRYHKGSNIDRIKGFIDEHSDWKNKDKVSIPQLYYNLKFVLSDVQKRNSSFYKEIENQIRSTDKGAIRDSDSDPELKDIIIQTSHWVEKECIKNASYSNLFHEYRNWLVHVFLDPGHPHEFDEKIDAYYFPKVDPDEPQQLGFPVKLFEEIVRGCLEGLLEYCEKENVKLYGKKGVVEKEVFHDVWAFKKLKNIKKKRNDT